MITFVEMIEKYDIEELELFSGSFTIAFTNGLIFVEVEDVSDIIPIVIESEEEFRCTRDFSITTMHFFNNFINKDAWANRSTSFERFK